MRPTSHPTVQAVGLNRCRRPSVRTEPGAPLEFTREGTSVRLWTREWSISMLIPDAKRSGRKLPRQRPCRTAKANNEQTAARFRLLIRGAAAARCCVGSVSRLHNMSGPGVSLCRERISRHRFLAGRDRPLQKRDRRGHDLRNQLHLPDQTRFYRSGIVHGGGPPDWMAY